MRSRHAAAHESNAGERLDASSCAAGVEDDGSCVKQRRESCGERETELLLIHESSFFLIDLRKREKKRRGGRGKLNACWCN